MEVLTAYSDLLVRVGLYLVIFWPTVGYYIYRDATNREISSPAIRGLAYGFFGILGLFVYLYQKTQSETNTA